MADEKKAAKQYDSIIDAILDEREPDWKKLDLSEAQKSGDEWLDRSHQYVDTEFEDEIAESASRHTPVWKNSARAYEERIAEKEAAAPRVSAVQADWHKDARRDTDAYSTQMGDNDSLINELTMSLEKAQSSGNLKENSADKKEVSDAQIFKYVKDLLNQGMAPSKVAKKLEKIAEIELFNHQSATDYLQRNAGLMGLAYLEPNSFMDKSSPTYGRTASANCCQGWYKHDITCVYYGKPKHTPDDPNPETRKKETANSKDKNKEAASGDPRWITLSFPAVCKKCGAQIGAKEKAYYYPQTKTLYCAGECGQAAARDFESAAFDERQMTGSKTADMAEETDAERAKRLEEQRQRDARGLSRNGPKEAGGAEELAERAAPSASDVINALPQRGKPKTPAQLGLYEKSDTDLRLEGLRVGGDKTSNDCVQQKRAWDNAGIKPQARSVKQVAACPGCSYFKQSMAGKTCNLYHLPVVANTQELTQIVNHLTPGVPVKRKHAALVAIANGEDRQVQPATIDSQINVIKAADAKAQNQGKRASYMFSDSRETSKHFESDHVAKLHEKGAPLEQIYKWATEKFGDVDTSFAFRGFVQSLKRDAKGKVVVASADLKFLNGIGIRGEQFQGAAKCASCDFHKKAVARSANPLDEPYGRVEQKFASRTIDVARNMQPEAKEIVVTAGKVRTLHQAGHSLAKIYSGAANKVGSVQAKKAVAGFVEDMKKRPGKIAVSESDRAFLVGKLGFKPEAVRMLDPNRRPVTQVVASVPEGQNILSYPGMGKQAGERKAADGHALLNEYDLTGSHEMDDIDVSGPKRDDVEMGSSFRVELE